MQQYETENQEPKSGMRLKIESRRSEIDPAVEDTMRLLQTLPCTHGILDEVELALSEALANAVVHGNHEDPAKEVEICGVCESPRTLTLTVTDQGDGFDIAALQDPTVQDNRMLTHGRGIFLMRRLVDDVEFRLGGRQVVLRRGLLVMDRIRSESDGPMHGAESIPSTVTSEAGTSDPLVATPATTDPGGASTPVADLNRRIACLAFSYWDARGRAGGSELEDWLRAEHELKQSQALAAE